MWYFSRLHTSVKSRNSDVNEFFAQDEDDDKILFGFDTFLKCTENSDPLDATQTKTTFWGRLSLVGFRSILWITYTVNYAHMLHKSTLYINYIVACYHKKTSLPHLSFAFVFYPFMFVVDC